METETLASAVISPLKLFASRGCLGNLYSPENKIIVAQSDRELVASLEPLTGLAVYEFSPDNSRPWGTIAPLGESDDAEMVELQQPPAFCLGFLVMSDAGRQQLASSISWWRDRGGKDSIPEAIFLEFGEDLEAGRAQFWQQIAHRLACETLSLATRLSHLQQQYLEMRTRHETMQNAVAGIEAFLSIAQLPPLELAFENPPASVTTPETGVLTQLLPVSSRGLAALDLYVATIDRSSQGILGVTLETTDDRTRLASWQIPYTHLLPGWFGLDLPTVDMSRPRDVELCLEWKTQAGSAPVLALGEPQPLPEFRATFENQKSDRGLAFRLWQGLPGTRRVMSPYSDSPQSRGILGSGVTSRVLEITPNADETIQILEDGGKILTEARSQTPTIAMLPFCISPGATTVRATVATEDPEADIVEYAMAAIAEGCDPIPCFENGEGALAFSGWVPIKPNEPHQIGITYPAADFAHLAIAARVPTGSSPERARATWHRFTIDDRPHPETETPTPAPGNSPENTHITDYPRVVHPRDAIAPETAPLSRADIAKLREALPASNRVKFVNNNSKIEVWPMVWTNTVAILPHAIPLGATGVWTQVCTENKEAVPVEYAIALVAADDDISARKAIDEETNFSGWQRVEPYTPQEIAVQLDTPADRDYHLVLSTRVTEGVAKKAWARWTDIQPLFPETPRPTSPRLTLPEAVALREVPPPSPRVKLLKDRETIEVFPMSQGETVAILPGAVRQGVAKVLTRVCTENAEATDVEYAIAVVANDDDLSARQGITEDGAALGFSGWQRVKPCTPKEINVKLETPTEGDYHLVLATRLPKGGSTHKAWARWVDVRLELGGDAGTRGRGDAGTR